MFKRTAVTGPRKKMSCPFFYHNQCL